MKQITLLAVAFMLIAGVASAHVTVKPSEVGVGSFQTFSISVPTERDMPTTGLRIVIPEGLEHVSPTVKPGWTIRMVEEEGEEATAGEHEEGVVKEIIWSGGSIPAHFRDDFTFSAKVPAQTTTLLWKAYQTYRDGSIVSWELAPNQEQPKNQDGSSDYSKFGPASQTKIIDDLSNTDKTKTPQQTGKYSKNSDALFVSMLAVVLSVLAIYFAKRK